MAAKKISKGTGKKKAQKMTGKKLDAVKPLRAKWPDPRTPPNAPA